MGRKTQGTVSLNISEYNDIYLKVIQHNDLKVENEQLKEDLAIARKQLEELQQPDENDSYVIAHDKDDPTKSIRLCDKYIYSIKDDGNVKHVGTIEKQDTENYNTPDELLIKLIQKQGLYATQLQIEELLNRQSRD